MASEYQQSGNAPGAHDQPIPARTDQIPLVCFICPKNSNFSDLSHLLTHISSKGHLHNMFQLNLVREVDAEAELAIVEFDAWYKHNGIGALLRARKTAREQRDNNQRRNQTSSGFGDNTMAARPSNRGGRSGRRGRGNNRTGSLHRNAGINALDESDIVKFESDDDEVHNRHGYHSAPYAWHSGSPYPTNPNHYANQPTTQFQDYLEDEDDSSRYEASELYSPYPTEDTPDTIEDDTGALILKGVVYPGMSGFDSATEKDRRMRNQKKDPAVLLKLEANSQLVTRVEEVLDTNLNYHRTRDVYDEPSIDGSGVGQAAFPCQDDNLTELQDEDDDVAVNETRTRRRTRARSSYSSTKRRANTRSRQQIEPTGNTRATRSSNRRVRGPSLSTTDQPAMSSRRVTRSSTNRQGQLPLHSHGVHPNAGSLHNGNDQPEDDEGFRTHIHAPAPRPLRRHQHERLPGLALRPGNPNAAFASPAPNFKKSPSRYSGKENSHLLIKSPSSFNPYLHPSGDSIEASNYNPLCPQPRDEFGYPLYSPYDEEPKSSTTPGFNPINGNSAYDSAHITGMPGNPYHRSQTGGDDYQL
ncbi:hypothetical protein O1611_g5874 [Lasiodiplodia mahajangana]|uniref:Uncharacterized protein n=1 Tax=Lasiodiplodia mahajangana TaxID=1108764 RepID=A0ACC2JJR6_9PEZI|nr:hypothetical protein O1611_g5874 [Lasiodiplodia mahajangana]